jgi:hypothetical protein
MSLPFSTFADDHEARAFVAGLEAEAQRQLVPFRGGHVAWRRFGTGPPLVLLRGGHGRWLHWARNIRAWAKQHTVWVPDAARAANCARGARQPLGRTPPRWPRSCATRNQ